MTHQMRNILLIQLAIAVIIAAIFGVLVALVWDGLGGIDPTISPGPPWLAGLIGGSVVLAGVVITALVMRKNGDLDERIAPVNNWKVGPDLHRLAASVVEDDTHDRPSRT